MMRFGFDRVVTDSDLLYASHLQIDIICSFSYGTQIFQKHSSSLEHTFQFHQEPVNNTVLVVSEGEQCISLHFHGQAWHKSLQLAVCRWQHLPTVLAS